MELPPVTLTAPPILALPEAPAWISTDPPVEDMLFPTTSEIEPDIPLEAIPVDSRMEPEFSLLVPELTEIEPEAPSNTVGDVATTTLPVLPLALPPLVTDTDPPVPGPD